MSTRNGPSCIQFQARWLEKLINKLEDEGVESFEATEVSADDWVEQIREKWNATLFPKGKISASYPNPWFPVEYMLTCLHSWWSGANIPGKKVQPLSWAGGLPSYMQLLDKTLENNYQDWSVVRRDPKQVSTLTTGVPLELEVAH